MVAINLFHEPTFEDKLTLITSPAQISALLAAMCSFAARFHQENTLSFSKKNSMSISCPKPDQLLALALEYSNQSLVECDDEPPPICVLQALVIATHCQLTRGVHGKAWRSLGMCVRLAYELNLHLLDAKDKNNSDREDPKVWRHEEERRRAWWAIWEMDVFASTIKRTPTAIDWSHMDIFLPVDDWFWFHDHRAPSAFMERDPIERWKTLERTGNHSPKAWFLVINSLMKDAQIISSPHGVRLESACSQTQDAKQGGRTPRYTHTSAGDDTLQRLEVLANAIQCFVMALPSQLRYRNQYLSFDLSAGPGASGCLRQLHCGVYNIFVMTQLARLMVYRFDLFRQPTSGKNMSRKDGRRASNNAKACLEDLENRPMQRYFEAADNIVSIVNGSCEDHVQHINPFLPSTIWLAAAVQLVQKHMGRSSTNPSLVKSRFDVLYLTYKRCVDFWDTETALQQNLEALEAQLEEHFKTNAAETLCAVSDAPRNFRRKSQVSPSSWIHDDADIERTVGRVAANEKHGAVEGMIK